MDERLSAPGSHGVVVVRANDRATALAVEQHISRRAAASARPSVSADLLVVDSCWCELAARLGLPELSSDPSSAARQISESAEHHVLVVVGTIHRGTWDDEVLQELAREPARALCLVVQDQAADDVHIGAREGVLVVDGSCAQDASAWWSGIVVDATARFTGHGLGELDAWWRWASRNVGSAPSTSTEGLSDIACRLLTRLHLVARAWPKALLRLLAPQHAWDELLDRALTVDEQGFVRAEWDTEQGVPVPEDLRVAADALERAFPRDPWACARAGRLRAEAGDYERAEASFLAAVGLIENASLRRQVWRGWLDTLHAAAPAVRAPFALHSAGLALDRDDVDIALRLSQMASSGSEGRAFEATFLTARAQLARGDVVAARVSLERALHESHDDAERACVYAQQAEAAYVTGELDQAAAFAARALDRATSAEVRLSTRNTLGKLLLAQSRWDAADEHFAADEQDAACAGLEMARVRARVNRAIALLSKGRAEAARTMLESVLQESESRRDLRAMAFALSNLAVLAVDRHDYAEALALSERAIEIRRRVGDRVGLARVVTNLAELRLRLGLVREAEQALAFGRQSLGATMPPTRAAHFALVAARVHLARGETLDAAREVAAAIADAGGSSDGAMLGECHRVAARIALEDGDVARAAREIERAVPSADSPFAKAEVSLLQAMLAQSRGDDPSESADAALAKARESGDDDLLRDCHLLLADLARAAGELDDACRHLASSEQLRDRIAGSLPDALRAAYLSRRELGRIPSVRAAIERADRDRATPPSAPVSTTSIADRAPPVDFIGSHPSVQRLLSAVGKVARTRAPVLIRGESGTGKELIAEALHRLSDRRLGPLVKVNCAALVETLLLSELFGHEKGAFTGAAARRRGRFELADGGTLFLDEIGDISARTQVALLRVLQDQTFERVGGSATLRADVRIVCATNRDLKALVAQGVFREDLYYRLCGVTLEIPALRARAEDIPTIAGHLLGVVAKERNEQARSLSAGALALLQHYPWPGNVRELDNVLRASSLFCEAEQIDPETIREHLHPTGDTEATWDLPPQSATQAALPAEVPGSPTAGDGVDPSTAAYDEIRNRGASLSDLKRQIERDCIQRALQETSGNITRAATLLGMKRPRLSQLVKQYGLLESTSEEL